jgi:hypothetical protein
MRRNGKKQQMHNTIFYYKIRHGSLWNFQKEEKPLDVNGF